MKSHLNLQCSILNHEGEPINFLCLQSNCCQNGLICYLCKLEKHNGHANVVTVKMFIGRLLKVKEGEQKVIREVAELDRMFFRIQDKVKQHKYSISVQHYEIIEQAYFNFARQTKKQINAFHQIMQQLNTINTLQKQHFVNALNSWIRKNSDLYFKQTQQQASNGSNVGIYKQFLLNRIMYLDQIYKRLDKLMRGNKWQGLDLLQLFIIEKGAGKMQKLHFSQQLKGICMTIHSPTRASQTTTGGQRMMLLQPHLGWNSSIKKWKVKIQKLASWIGVGVAHLDSIKNVNFDFSYTNAGHGNYLISANGYSWNGYKMQFNSKHGTPSFITGDVIQVTYDPKANKVTFRKQGEAEELTYQIDPEQKPIHAAINMSGVGDCVQLI